MDYGSDTPEPPRQTIGVSVARMIAIKKVDSDYFEDA